MQRVWIGLGLLLILIGVLWPWLAKLPLGRLPGDIMIQRPGLRVYFPFATMLLVSLALSLLLWLLRR